MNVLIGVDTTEESKDAVEVAFQFFGAEAKYTLVSVSSGVHLGALSYGVGTVGRPKELAARHANAERKVEAAAGSAATFFPDGLPTEIETELGQAGPVIVSKAEELSSDVIVIGSRDRSLWDRLFEPSAGRHIVENAPCPVLVVR